MNKFYKVSQSSSNRPKLNGKTHKNNLKYCRSLQNNLDDRKFHNDWKLWEVFLDNIVQ